VRVPVRYARVGSEASGPTGAEGHIVRLASHCVELLADRPLGAMADLRMSLAAAGDSLATRDFYGKVIGDSEAGTALVRLTSTPPEVDAFFEALRRYAAGEPA
jgi:hypothetical protein